MKRWLVWVGFFVSAGVALGQPISKKLTLRPASAPVPALRYRLLPPADELMPGNAATFYYRAFAHELSAADRSTDDSEKLETALDMPLNEVDRSLAARYAQDPRLQELDAAARVEHCDWGLSTRLQGIDGRFFAVPELSGFRTLARRLALRTRLQIGQREYDKAIAGMQTGLALARNVGDMPIVIGALIGMAMAQDTLGQLEALMQAPDAPNLYWALTDLPDPLIGLRKSIESESTLLANAIPHLAEAKTSVLSPQEAEELTLGLVGVLRFQPVRSHADAPFAERMAIAMLTAKFYPQAREFLLASGRDRAQVEAMPPVQAVTLYSWNRYLTTRDDFLKWSQVPYPQAIAGAHKAEERLRQSRAAFDEGIPLASNLLPVFQKPIYYSAALQRRIAALRCIEALRMYAAGHGGQPPARLEDIQEVPVPLDPMSGKPFEYQVNGNTATLASPAQPKDAMEKSFTVRYELTFAPR